MEDVLALWYMPQAKLSLRVRLRAGGTLDPDGCISDRLPSSIEDLTGHQARALQDKAWRFEACPYGDRLGYLFGSAG